MLFCLALVLLATNGRLTEKVDGGDDDDDVVADVEAGEGGDAGEGEADADGGDAPWPFGAAAVQDDAGDGEEGIELPDMLAFAMEEAYQAEKTLPPLPGDDAPGKDLPRAHD